MFITLLLLYLSNTCESEEFIFQGNSKLGQSYLGTEIFSFKMCVPGTLLYVISVHDTCNTH